MVCVGEGSGRGWCLVFEWVMSLVGGGSDVLWVEGNDGENGGGVEGVYG